MHLHPPVTFSTQNRLREIPGSQGRAGLCLVGARTASWVTPHRPWLVGVGVSSRWVSSMCPQGVWSWRCGPSILENTPFSAILPYLDSPNSSVLGVLAPWLCHGPAPQQLSSSTTSLAPVCVLSTAVWSSAWEGGVFGFLADSDFRAINFNC